MPELPWEKWYPTNWAAEPGLKLCEAATRGIWFEMINTMMLKQSSFVRGTVQQLSMLCSCQTSQMELAMQQIKEFDVGEVEQQDGNIIVTCRRRARDCNIRQLRSKAGKASATKRKHTPQQGEGTPSASASASASVLSDEGVKGEKYHKDARAALHVLNEASARHFRETDPNLTIISARLREPGVDLEGVKAMLIRQCNLWKEDQKMCEYLRPETLFGKSKFDSYYAAKDLPITNGRKAEQGQLQEIINVPTL